MKKVIIIFTIFFTTLTIISSSNALSNNKLLRIRILNKRIAGIIDKPKIINRGNELQETEKNTKNKENKSKKRNAGDTPAVEENQGGDTRPIPEGREFQINIPGTKKRVLLFGNTSIYYIKRKVSELKTNAYVKSLDYEIYADRLLYFESFPKRKLKDGKPVEQAQAWGNVRILEKKKRVQIYGSAAYYFPKRKYMRVTGGAHMLDEKQKIEVHGQTMERYTKKNILIVTGNVELKKPKDGLHITAFRMRYNTKTKFMVLTGNVRITQRKKNSKRFIAGSRVVINEDEKTRTQKLDIDGNGIIRDYKKGKLEMTASADEIDYYTKKDSKGKRIIEKTNMDGHVRIITKKQDIMAMKVDMNKDEKKDEWVFNERVLIKDKKTKDEIRGGYLFFDRKKEIMHVLKNPQLYISKENATVNSDVLKSYRKDKLTLFIGDVEIVQDDKRIFGEKALLNEKIDRMKITGEPLLIDKENITYSDEIIFFTKKKEVRLSSKFHGVLTPKQKDKNDKNKKPGKKPKLRKDIPVGDIGGPEIL